MVSNPSVSLFGIQPIGMEIGSAIDHLKGHLDDDIDIDDYDTWTAQTFIESWGEIQETLGYVTEVNFGVPYDDEDNAIWPKLEK